MLVKTYLLMAALAVTPVAGVSQMMAPPAPAPTEAKETPGVDRNASRNKALAFLKRVEEKNQDTKTLQAKFTQVRMNATFLEEVKSEGEFWYSAPNRFHAKYKSENDSELWMTADQYVEYIPSLRQVDVIPLQQGEDAPINQLLLGFGVKVDEIRKLFDVSMGEPVGQGTVTVNFQSKDLDRTMSFQTIAITFDEETALPRRIVLEDVQSDLTTLEFQSIKFNPGIDERVFEIPKWPKRVTVNYHE